MKQRGRKCFSLALAAALCLGLHPVSALAEDGDVPEDNSMALTDDGGLLVEDTWASTGGSAAIPATGTACASTQPVLVDGQEVVFYAYALKDERGYPTNYIRLRDVALALNGTAAQFSVDYQLDAQTIAITTGFVYTANGSEMVQSFSGDQPYQRSDSLVRVNGVDVDLAAIRLTDAHGGGYTYFKLRDLGTYLGFNVSWNGTRIVIDSNTLYDPSN